MRTADYADLNGCKREKIIRDRRLLDWATDEHRFSQIKKAFLSDLCFICVNLWLTPPCFFRLFMISATSASSAVVPFGCGGAALGNPRLVTYRSLQRGSQQRLVGGMGKSHACVVAADWLRRIPCDARMMKTHDRISLVTRPRRKMAMT